MTTTRSRYTFPPRASAIVLGILGGSSCGGLTGNGTAGDAGSQGAAVDGGSGTDSARDAGHSSGLDAASACADATSWRGLDPSLNPVGPIALDATDIYWMGSSSFPDGPYALVRTPKSGGATVTLATQVDFNLALDKKRAYFTRTDAMGTTLFAVDKAGGTPVPLASQLPALDGIVADDDAVYFFGANGVSRVPNSGGAVSILSPAPSIPCPPPSGVGCAYVAFGLDSADVYWEVLGGHSNDLTYIGATSTKTGAVRKLVEIDVNGWAVTLGERDVFFSGNRGPGTLWAVPKTGGSYEVLATGVDSTPIASDGAFVYLAMNAYTTLVRIPVGGGVPSRTAAFVNNAAIGVALDETAIYWAQASELSSALMRVCK